MALLKRVEQGSRPVDWDKLSGKEARKELVNRVTEIVKKIEGSRNCRKISCTMHEAGQSLEAVGMLLAVRQSFYDDFFFEEDDYLVFQAELAEVEFSHRKVKVKVYSTINEDGEKKYTGHKYTVMIPVEFFLHHLNMILQTGSAIRNKSFFSF